MIRIQRNSLYILILYAVFVLISCEDNHHNETKFEWKEILNMPGTHIRSIIAKDSLLFASTLFHGVIVSSNSGKTWNEVNNGMANDRILCLVKDADIYAASRELYVYRSTNNGSTWNELNLGLPHYYGNLTSMAIRDSTLFVGAYEHGVIYSTDKGANWKKINNPALTYVNSLYVSESTVYAGTYDGLFICTINDSVWLPMHSALSELNVVTIERSGMDLFLGTAWSSRDSIIPGTNYMYTSYGELLGLNNELPNYGAYASCSYSENLFAGFYGDGLYWSTDGGNNWINISGGINYTDDLSGLYVTFISVIDSTLFVGSVGRIHTLPLSKLKEK
ncbi:hypothetical protein JNL27_14940 [bacterium]|nr:hypothetical protein [bacterium]